MSDFVLLVSSWRVCTSDKFLLFAFTEYPKYETSRLPVGWRHAWHDQGSTRKHSARGSCKVFFVWQKFDAQQDGISSRSAAKGASRHRPSLKAKASATIPLCVVITFQGKFGHCQHLIVGCFPQPSYNRTIRQPKKLQCEIPTPSHRMHYSCLVFHFILFVPSLARNHRVTSAADVINRSIHHGTCVIQRGRQRVNRMLLVQVQGFYETTIGIHQLKILLMAYFQ